MKAAVIREHGDVDVIRVEDVPTPRPGAGEVLVEVKAAALNHLDVWVRKGGRARLTMPHILGSDAAGIIAAVGEGVVGVRAGDEVVINPGISCGHCEFCRAGEQSQCGSFGIVGLSRAGTFAQYVAVPAGNIAAKPAHLSITEAAALPLAHLTAWRMLMTKGGCRPGSAVLIHGVGGGVALAALQLAKLAGATAVVTSSSDDKLSRAAKLGADHAINYAAVKDVAADVRAFTGGRGVDIVIDTAGAATLATSLSAVRRGGRIVTCGVTSGAEAKIDLQALYWNQVTLAGSTMGSHEDFRSMLAAVAAARLRPVIDAALPLDGVRQAARRMETAGQFGKIVLEIK
ncbi:MAG: zinc-binding dehydrogenase [Phycisphaerae bacterium]